MCAKILVTGFGPFAGRTRNGSDVVAARLAAEHPGLVFHQSIPTTWSAARAQVISSNYTHVVGLGEGPAHAIYVERLGTSGWSGKDIEDKDPPKAEEDEANPVLLDLDWEERERQWAAGLVPSAGELGFDPRLPSIVPNYSAGSFCCNAYAHALGRFRDTERPDLTVGFIHIPPMDEWIARNHGRSDAEAYVRVMTRAVRAVLVGNGWNRPY